MSFELLEHPADIGFRAQAPTLARLFEECARALQFLVFDPFETDHNVQIQLDAEGGDAESLLVNWLNELLYHVDSQHLAFDSFEIGSFDGTRIECVGRGGRRDRTRYPDKLLVKAVTYHQLRIAKSGDLLSADVYVDI